MSEKRDHKAFARSLQGSGIHLLGRLLLQVYRQYNERAAQKFDAAGHEGVTAAHVPIFACIAPEGSRIVSLAESIGTTKQYMGRLVGDLVEKGYLVSTPDPTDGRASLIKVTEKGYQLMDDIERGKQEIEAEYAAQLGQEKMHQLVALLEELAGAMPAEWNVEE
ncbi:MAG: MarR family winged helix-turn-helix transcriptional regulator [Anaerolineae bacterium]